MMVDNNETTIAEILATAHEKGTFTRHFTYTEALSIGEPFNIGREIKSFIFLDGSVIEFGPVVITRPF
jgi:hypothetical protein